MSARRQSSPAAGSSIVRVDYYRNNSLIASANAPSQGNNVNGTWSTAWNLATPGNYRISARAIDNLGRIGISEDIDFQARRANAANPAPTVVINSPAAGQTFTVGAAPNNSGANITLSANAIDNSGSILQVQFYNGSSLIGNATLVSGSAQTGTWTLNWPNLAPGNFNLTARLSR